MDLYFSSGYQELAEEEPEKVCFLSDADDDYYGFRICNNLIAAGVINIFMCVILLIIDLFNPCLNSGVSKPQQ